MHLIFATSLVTAGPPESGYEIANHALLAGLRRQGMRVTELGFTWAGTTPTNPDQTVCLGEVDVKTESASGKQKLLWLAKAIRTSLPFACAKLKIIDEPAFERALAQAERTGGRADAIVLNGVTLAGAYERILTRRPFLFVAHNVEHVSAQQNARDAAGFVEKVMYRREAHYLRKLETRLCAGAKHVLTLTEEDRHGLHIDQDDKSTAVPLVTPKPPANPSTGRIKAFDVGMIGTWTWTPNRIGLEWFLQNVVPLLPADMSIAVAGKTPRGLRARDKRVVFLGRVENAKDFSRQCRVIALSSRVGTGVQLKTIEAFEMGLACAATTSSMRGISHIPSNVRVADRPRAYAEAVVELASLDRAGEAQTADGMAFRTAQQAAMDDAVAKALNCVRQSR